MDDTTRGVGPRDEFSGRREETTRDYASTPGQPGTRRPEDRPGESARGTGQGSTDLDPESERRTREIEGEIAHTRAELSETIDALQEKLRPGNIVSDAAEKVKSATSERMRSMADTASGTAQGMVQGARQNPIPALMIGAGVAWFLIDRTRQHREDGPSREAERSRYSSQHYPSGESYEYDRTSGEQRVEWVGQHRRMQGVTNWARNAGHKARQTSTRARSGIQRMMHQNPLLVGAAAMLAGAAVGATIPETEKEKEWMGDTRDRMVDRAQEVAEQATGAVKDAAQNVVGDTVSKVAERVTSPKER